jgi:DNA-binding CsgD family transcriptional regulator
MNDRRGDGSGLPNVPWGARPVSGRSHPDALVGRRAECEALSDLVHAVRSGLSGSMMLVGEAGMGKTRLLEYAAEAAGDLQTVRIAGVESEARLGFAAAHRLLVPFLDRIEGLPQPQRDALRLTFGLIDGTPPDRFLVGLGALTLLARAAVERPLICLVDDAQWLDRESLGVLGFVARRLHADRIGLLFGARMNSTALGALDGVPTRHVGALDSAAARILLDATVSAPVNARVAARIIAETGGSPLAMLELLGQLTAGQLAGRLALPQPLPVGRSMEAYFLRQVEILPAGTQSLLLLASAASNDDPGALWRAAALLGIAPDAASPEEARDMLSLEPRVAFRHPLIRSAVYNGAEPSNRRAAHEALAMVAGLEGELDQAAWHRAAATFAPDEDVAADLERSAGRAARRGGQAAQATFLTRAADLTPNAQDRAVRWFNAARAHLAAGDGVLGEALLDQAAPWLDAAGMHVEVQRLRASIAVFFSRHKDAPAILLDAVTTVEPHEVSAIRDLLFEALQAALVARQYTSGMTPVDVARRAMETPRDPSRTASGTDLLLDGFATRLAVGYAPAVPLLRNAVAVLFTDEDLAPVGIPATILGWFAADDVWDEQGRRDMFERAQAIERRHGALGALRITLAGLCTSLVWAGQMDEAEGAYLEAAEISALIGVPPPATTGVLLEVRAWQGREEESRAMAAITAEWGQQRGASILEIFALFGLTVLEQGLGRYAEALAWGARIYDDDPPGFGNRILPEIVEAGVRCGNRDTAQAALIRLADRATVSGTPWALGLLARSRALFAADEDAESLYRQAVEQLQNTSVRTETARTHLLFGEWLRRQKRRKDAQAQLGIAYDMFDAMGATAFASRARGEQLATGLKPRESAERPSLGLTPQEAHVARLAAGGATNAEIATRLFLTTSTVEYHLSKVFRKLGITSRRQLATTMTR